ncbi:MAG: acyltransferase [Sphingomonadales bacterium]|nr:acyltransferase [Sphingomonadales bacterium]
MTSSAAQTDRLVMLDGLRGIAAIGVMLYHLEVVFDAGVAFSRCYLFVDLFFLLSGFVLARNSEARMTAPGGARRFLAGRVRRLWPMVALGVAAGCVVELALGDPARIPLLAALALMMIPAFGVSQMLFPLNGPQWSLLMELLANLAHALVLSRISDRVLLGGIAIAGWLLAAMVLHVGSDTVGPFMPTLGYAAVRIAYPYMLGVWMARRHAGRTAKGTLGTPTVLVLPAAVLLILPGVPLAPAFGDLACVLLLFPTVVWAAANAAPPSAVRPALARLGGLSFPLYAIHLPILQLMASASGGAASRTSAICLALAGADLVARIAEPKRRRHLAVA